jgi:hypothetical protein
MSYVLIEQVGDILSRLALPTDAVISGLDDGISPDVSGGQSLASLLRDPALIFKLVVLSGLSLLPVLFKVSGVTRARGPRLRRRGRRDELCEGSTAR